MKKHLVFLRFFIKNASCEQGLSIKCELRRRRLPQTERMEMYYFKNSENGKEVQISKTTNAYLTYSLTLDGLEFEFADKDQPLTPKSVIQTERVVDVIKNIISLIKANPDEFAVNELNLLVEFLQAQNCAIDLYKN